MNQLNPQHLTTRPFARVAQADALPGRCLRCPRNSDLVDLGAPGIPNFGVAYICTVCLGDLMNQMKVIGFEQHQAAVTELSRQNQELEERLAAAIDAKNAPVEFVTEALEEFTNGVSRNARDLIARLGSYSAPGVPGGGGVAADAAEPAEPRVTDVPDEPAHVDPVEPERVAEPAAAVAPAGVGADDADALVAALLGTDAVPAAPAGADAGSDGGALHVGGASGGLDLLYDQAAE